MRPIDPDELTFRKRTHERRSETSIKPETWAIIVMLLGVLLLAAMWVRTTQNEALSEVVLHAPVPAPLPNAVSTTRDEVTATYQEAELTQSDINDQRWIYKCRGPSGVNTFRSEGCVEDEEMLERKLVLLKENAPARVVAAASQRLTTATSRYGQAAYIPSGNAASYARSRCDIAKAERQEARDRLGMSITYDGITRLDDMVREACK